ncbi:MAG: hypothetical protein MUF42_02255 [Cytophagaceae bacterium]|jgi:hypothetical protein|nr:hypothetical protein [Cytophagaceae bacterium]
MSAFQISVQPCGTNVFLTDSPSYEISHHTVWEGAALVAQGTLYYNPQHRFQEFEKVFCLGSIKAKDRECLQALLQSLEAQARQQEAQYLWGPMNGSTWESYRWGASSDFPPFFSEETVPSFYLEAIECEGFEKIARYQSNWQNLNANRPAPPAATAGITIRRLDKSNLRQELEHLAALALEGFKKNLFYTPISRQAFVEKYLRMEKWLEEDFVWLAWDGEKKCCGLLLAFRDFLQPNQDTLVLKTIVRLPGREYAGLIHQMQEYLFLSSQKHQIQHWIHAYMWSQNNSRALSEKYNGTCIREYFLFGKKIGTKN